MAPAAPQIYLPNTPLAEVWNQLFLLVRTTGDPRAALPSVRGVVRGIDPDQAVYGIRTLDEVFDEVLLQARVSAWLMGAFAALALAIAAIGLYGVLSFAVSSRTREIGIRMALGADRTRVVAGLVGDAAWLASIGTAIGLAGALALGGLNVPAPRRRDPARSGDARGRGGSASRHGGGRRTRSRAARQPDRARCWRSGTSHRSRVEAMPASLAGPPGRSTSQVM